MEKKLQQVYSDYKNQIENVVMPENAGGYNFVWGFGNIDSEIILVGEAPGKDEVKIGEPFVGKAGSILDEFLLKTGIERNKLFITNTIKYRLARRAKGSEDDSKLANRPAKTSEIEIGAKLLEKEIEIIKPRIVVTMGNVPLKALTEIAEITKKDKTIGSLHGMGIETRVGDHSFLLFPIYHPASLIYNHDLRDTYQEDLLNLKNIWFSLH